MTRDIFLKHYYENLPKLLEYYNTYQNEYNLAFFGGEPLLNINLIVLVTKLLETDKNNVGRTLVTNGLLLNNKIYDILINDLRLNISLSFDGLWNKNNRVNHNNKSTFDEYLNNKKDIIQKINFSKVMISPNSLKEASLLENYLFFKNTFGDNFRESFTLVRDDIWDNNSINLFKEQSRELIDHLLNEINIKKRKEIHLPGIYELIILDIINADKIGFKRPFGCFAGINGAGFMPDGSVYPCARYGNDKIYILIDKDGNLNKKNLDYMRKVADITNFKECKSCEFYKYCNAGCTYQQMHNNVKPVDSICQLFRILYNDVNYFLENVNDDYKYFLRRFIIQFFENINNR